MSSPMPPRAPRRSSKHLARMLDDLVRIPGTQIGIGLDAVLGLLPGLGDLLGSALSGAIMYDAIQARVPVPVLARMAWNIVLDALLGLVPVGGDLLDVAHRANRKNYRLLSAHLEAHPVTRPPTLGYLAAATALTVLPLLLSLALAGVALWLLWRLISRGW